MLAVGQYWRFIDGCHLVKGTKLIPSNLVIAGYSVAIDCSDESIMSYLHRELKPFIGGDGTDMRLSLALDWADDTVCPESSNGHISVTLPTGLDICLEQDSADGDVRLRAVASRPPAGDEGSRDYLNDFLINYIFSLVIQQLQADGKAHIFLVHSCGVIHEGRGYLFAGVSGKGKSTIARQLAAAGESLLGDDMVLVSHDIDGWQVHGSPMGGEISRATLVNDSVPLAAIYLIEQEALTTWRAVSPAAATAALIGLVVPSYPLTRVAPKQLADYSQETVEILLDEASLLAMSVPCFHLGLSLGEQPWDRIFDYSSKREADKQ